jgi:hypothetical protein
MERGRKKRWSELSPQQRTLIVVSGVAEFILTTLAIRDLRDRPKAEVRGWKIAWRMAMVVQPFGPLLYFIVGRRGSTTSGSG